MPWVHDVSCANQHAHFPGRAVAYAASICRALIYDLSLYNPFRVSASASIKTVARFVRTCSSRLPLPPLQPLLWRLQLLPLPLRRRQILRPLQMSFVQWSTKFRRSVLVHLEAAGTCKRNKGKSVNKLKTRGKTYMNMSQCCIIVRHSKLPTLQGEAPFAWLAELQTSGRSRWVQRPMQDTTQVAGFWIMITNCRTYPKIYPKIIADCKPAI